ncbi:glycosyltransferase, partial [Candidatus Methylomirabilis sp.]|uniref:glycosyltransferase n=1 Tax=Candidatus Methylomirabilis sp. TaxID=2032687 RepID=UPI003C70E34D
MTYERVIDDSLQDSLSQIAAVIPADSCVLDLGAASGALGKYLSSQKNCTVDGVEYDEGRAVVAKRWYRNLKVGDLEALVLVDHFPKNGYDFIVCADILEHLRSPGFLLSQFQALLADNGRVLLSVPNIAYAGVISSLMSGEFTYNSTGILDSTHVRFFTKNSLLRTLREHGLHILNLKSVSKDPRDSEFRKYHLDALPPSIFRAIAAQPEALAYQFIVEAAFQEEDVVIAGVPSIFPAFGSQLFWRFDGEEYATHQSRMATGLLGIDRQTIAFELPPATRPLYALRLDPADRPGFLYIYGMRLLDQEGAEMWKWAGDFASLACMPHRDIVFSPDYAKGGMLLTGDDPNIELPVASGLLARLMQGGKLEIELGWPLSADFLVMLDRLDKDKYLKANKLLRNELDRPRQNASNNASNDEDSAQRADNLHLRLKNHEIQDELRRAKDSIAHLQSQLDQAFMGIANLEVARRAMRASFSWRLTAPLRGLGLLLRLLRRVLIEILSRLVAVYKKRQEVTTPEGMEGHLDYPHPNSASELDSLAVSGWIFSKTSAIVSMSVSIDGKNEGPLTYGYERPDVAQAKPGYPSAGKSGFFGVCSLKHEKQGGRVLEIWATLQNGDRVKCFSRSVRARALAVPTISLSNTVRFLYGAYKKAWRAFREGRLPMSPAAWLLGLRRYRMSIQGRCERADTGGAMVANRNIILDGYQQWIETNRLRPKLLTRMKADAQRLANVGGAKISLVVAVYNPPRQFLEEMIESVASQVYPNWELCMVDDASTQPHVREMLEAAAISDSRIKVEFRAENGHIVKATNTALGMASGEYVALLDHDDVLPPEALLHVAECIARNPDADWIYTDEDKIDSAGRRFDPQFKGSWNPEMAITHNFTHHLTVIRKSLVEQVGRMRDGFEGAQDLDLFLRVAEKTEEGRIRHIPHVCYHWRSHSESTASHGAQKNYVFDSAYRAIADAVSRRGLKAEPFLPPFAEKHGLCLHQLRWKDSLQAGKEVTIVIPTRDQPDLLKRCISSLQRTVDARFVKLLIMDDRTTDARALEFMNDLEAKGTLQCRIVRPKRGNGKFNYARLINEAAEYVDTPFLLQLNNDIEAMEPGWLEELMGWMSIEGVGVAGARLLYPDQKIQ